ncbi:hypothetical protein ACFRDV_20280 [Streptomyces fagopyri]|uniref:hypothetical protein n=1 Tax=Streptomyces fagopyri TaxID=2662397 RepID=UPI0036A7E314
MIFTPPPPPSGGAHHSNVAPELWGLALTEGTRCRVHLEGPARLLPDWPTRR